jgi:Mrp family chromosome partitioning ATPase
MSVDSIRQAIELAKSGSSAQRLGGLTVSFPDQRGGAATDPQVTNIPLNPAHLETMRIVAHGGGTSPQSKYYDMLRTQVLQEMDKAGWQFLAVTSATPGCGKTVTACNLALSIARLPERAVMLVDMDLQKPKVSEYLGLNRQQGLLSILEGHTSLLAEVVQASIGRNRLLVLPGEICHSGASDWMASQMMSTLLQAIKRDFRSRIVIFDLPPILAGDDVISILPQMDAVLLVAGVGTTSVADIKECQKHIKGTPVVRVVVNKVTEATDVYRAYY